MYTKTVACHSLTGKPRNVTVHFNLFEREVFKLLVEFKAIFDWLERINTDQIMDVDPAEVVEYYNNFEEILLSAYGEPSEDDMQFLKGSRRYDFEDHVAFNALMVECVKDPSQTSKLIDGLMPKDMQELVKAADSSLAELAKSDATDADLRAKIEELQAQIKANTEG